MSRAARRRTCYALLTAGYRPDGKRAYKGMDLVAPAQQGQPIALATYMYYDGDVPIMEVSGADTITSVNVFAPDGLVARKVSGNWRYYQFDPQGSVTHRLTSDETVTNSSMYNAYGQHVTVPFAVNDPFGYNGRWGYYTDSNTGLILCTFRYYDPGQGRWLNRDPIGYAGGVNLYAYCGARAILFVDRDGLGWIQLVGGLLGGAAGAFIGGALGGPGGAIAGAAIGGGLGTAAGTLLEGGSGRDAAINGTVDAALTVATAGAGRVFCVVKAASKGRKAVDEPLSLAEQLVMEDARRGGGSVIDEGRVWRDPSLPPGTQKKGVAHTLPDGRTIEVHYWDHFGELWGRKFKSPPLP